MFQKTLILFFLLTFFFSCKDKSKQFVIEKNPFKVFPTRISQNILLENIESESNELSYQNSFYLAELKQKFPNLIIVSYHKQDWLETPATNEFGNLLGGFSSYPIASINRLVGKNTLLNEDNQTLLSPINWEYVISRAQQEIPQIGLAAETFIEKNTGAINLYFAVKEAIYDDTRFGLFMVQDNVKSLFQMGASTQDSFKHQHVLMETILPIEGNKIDLTQVESNGSIFNQKIEGIDLKLYNKETVYLVAFVFKYDKDFRKIKIYNAIQLKFGGRKYWNQ